MNKIERNIFVMRYGLSTFIDYVQGTNAIPIALNFRDWNIPSGAEARIFVKKPSGKEVYNSASVSGNTVTINPTTQMFAEAGEQEGQVQIVSSGKILVTYPIVFRVAPNLIEESAVESTNEYGILDGLIESARDAISKAEMAVDNAYDAAGVSNAAAEKANTAAGAASGAAEKANTAAESAGSAAAEAKSAAADAQKACEDAQTATRDAVEAAAAAQKVIDQWQGLEDASRVNALEEKMGKVLELIGNVLATE